MKKISSEFIIDSFSLPRTKNGKKKISVIDTLNIGIYLVTPLIMGVFGGLYLDTRYNTKPVFVLLGVIGGLFVVLYQLIKLVKAISRNAGN